MGNRVILGGKTKQKFQVFNFRKGATSERGNKFGV
jgi:hypothetical protein